MKRVDHLTHVALTSEQMRSLAALLDDALAGVWPARAARRVRVVIEREIHERTLDGLRHVREKLRLLGVR